MDALHAVPAGRKITAQSSPDHWRSARSVRPKLVGSRFVMPLVLPALVRALKRDYGCVTLEVDSAGSADVRRSVLEGESTLGVCLDVDRHPSLRYTSVLETQLGVLASPRLALPASIRCLDDLACVPFLRFGTSTAISQLLQRHGVRFDSYFASPLAVSCILTSFDVVQQGQAAVVCSGVGATHARAAGLRFIPLPGLLPVGEISIISRQDAIFDPAQEKLRQLLTASIQDTEWHPSVRRVRSVDATQRVMRSVDISPPSGPAAPLVQLAGLA